MSPNDKPLVWLHGEVKTPPFSAAGRIKAGFLLRRLQRGEKIGLPDSRAMPSVGSKCHELRLDDGSRAWRVMYRIDDDAILILEVFEKKTQRTPKRILDVCKDRLKVYDRESK